MTIWIQRVISPSLVWSPANLTSLRQKSFPKLSFLSGWFQEVLVCGRQELGVSFLYSHIGSGGNGLFSNPDKIQNKQTHITTNKQTVVSSWKILGLSVGKMIFHSLLMRELNVYSRVWSPLMEITTECDHGSSLETVVLAWVSVFHGL